MTQTDITIHVINPSFYSKGLEENNEAYGYLKKAFEKEFCFDANDEAHKLYFTTVLGAMEEVDKVLFEATDRYPAVMYMHTFVHDSCAPITYDDVFTQGRVASIRHQGDFYDDGVDEDDRGGRDDYDEPDETDEDDSMSRNDEDQPFI